MNDTQRIFAAISDLQNEVRALRQDHRELINLFVPLAINRGSRKEQAKRAGVSTVTLWRRERKARARIRADGRIPL